MKAKNVRKGRNEVIYNKPVGIIDGILYLVNYTFEDTLHNEPFNGVTGSVLEPITQEYINDANTVEQSKEYCRDLWAESVKNGNYEGSLVEFTEEALRNSDGAYLGHDESDVHYVPVNIMDEYFKDAVTFNCIGGGRCFRNGMKWDIVLDQHLVNEINRLEKPEVIAKAEGK